MTEATFFDATFVDATFVDDTWEQLREAARKARDLAYAPFSKHPVGAAAPTDDGRIVTGSNVENASLGVTLCAECSMVSGLVRTGKQGRLVAFACVGPNLEALLPCGRCRQLPIEHGGPVLLSFLLPDAFSGDDQP